MDPFRWLAGPTTSERIATEREKIRQESRNIERQIEEIERQISKERTMGNNRMHEKNKPAARTHYARVVNLRRQVVQLERTLDHMRQSETSLQLSETANTAVRAMDSASRAMDSANRRLPVSHVRESAMRMQRSRYQNGAKMDALAEAFEGDDDEEEDDAVVHEQDEINAMMEDYERRSLPMLAPPTTWAESLPELRPLHQT